jgi:O-antigen/teichoic acid export membrane protein
VIGEVGGAASPLPAGAALKARAARGAMALMLRSGITGLAAVVGGVVLARILTPTEFGIYAITAFCAAFLSMFGDVGLGAAIIQKQDGPTQADLRTVFTLQLVLASILVVAGFIAAGPVAGAYHLSPAAAWLMRALIATLLISVLRTVPAVLLERDLRYGRLGTVDASQGVTFQVAAVVAALLGFGVWSFVWATVISSVVGVVAAYTLSPWRPGFGFDRASARRLVSFGMAYQAQGILSFVKDAMTPTVVAVLAGAAAVGYVNWAFAIATAPLLVTGSLWQVTFPAFARAAHDPVLLARIVERAIHLGAIVMLPISFSIMALAPQIVEYVFGSKWDPALPSIYLFSVAFLTGPMVGSTFFNLFYATGHPRYSLYFTILYGVLDWGIGIPLVVWLGFNGIAIRTAIVAYVTLPPLLIVAERMVAIQPLRQLVRPGAVAMMAALLEVGTVRILPSGLPALLVALAVGGVAYVVVIAIADRALIRSVLTAVLPRGLARPLRWYLAGAAPTS